MPQNLLYYGDNLPILREHIADESVDLIYLDPPFKSNQDYNILFREQDGTRAAAQIKAFEDTWQWDVASVRDFQEVVESGGRVSQTMQALRMILGDTDMLAYLTRMAPRLVELHRVLKPTGTIYLHCDPTASHYLKLLMDAVFGAANFLNEVVWKRTTSHAGARRYAPVHDTLLFYAKGPRYTWNAITQEYDGKYVKKKYRFTDGRGRYRLSDLRGAGLRKGDSGKPWRGHDPAKSGRHWAVPKKLVAALSPKGARLSTQEKLDLLDEAGYVYWTPKGRDGDEGFPQYKRYLGAGMPVLDTITDIPPINARAKELLGYQTQKPEALLERIISASSNEGDTVLDPFCGCGTAVAVSQRLSRRWIGIDITHLAITLIRTRLKDAFGEAVAKTYKVECEPASVFDAAALAAQDRFQFQWWALSLVGARPTPPEQKKGKDKGIDGRLYFHDEPDGGRTKQVVFSVKSGGTGVRDVRDLVGVVTREKAAVGVLITLAETTRDMRTEAAEAGEYVSPWGGFRCPRIQLLTIEDLFDGAKVALPPNAGTSTFKKAPRSKGPKAKQKRLFD